MKANWQQALAEFQRQANVADTTGAADRVSEQDVRTLVELCAASDRHREAVDVIRRSEALGVHVALHSRVLVCCAVARKRGGVAALERMRQLHDALPDQFVNPSVYDPLLSIFKARGDYQSAHAAIAQMHEFGLTPHLRALRALLVTAGLAKQKDAVLATIKFVEDKFPNSKTDVPTLTAICQALVKVGETSRVLAIYKSLDNEWLAQRATTVLFNQFLLASIQNGAKPGRKKGASSSTPWAAVFDAMVASKHGQPDDFTFATCLLEWEKRMEWGQALDLFNSMQESEARSGSALTNALACSVAIRAIHKVDEADGEAPADSSNRPTLSRTRKEDLKVVLKKIESLKLTNLGHASTLVDTLDEFRQFTPARQVFERMMREGLIREHPWRQKEGYEIDLHTFSRGVAKCAVVFAFEEIAKQHRGLITSGQIPDDLRIITGVGRRSSEFMTPVLKNAVKELLTRSSRPPLWAGTHPKNPGVLLIRHNAMRKWLEKGGHIRYF